MALELVLGLVLLYLGADWLVRSAGSLSLTLGLTPLTVGLIIMGYGTATPELFVTIQSSFSGYSGLAVGNIVGANIFNLGAILGISLLFKKMELKPLVKKVDVPILVLTSFFLIFYSFIGPLTRLPALLLLVCLCIYTYKALIDGKKHFKQGHSLIERKEFSLPLMYSIPLLLLSLFILMEGSDLFVKGASALASTLGVSQSFIGITIVSIATSLPELMTTILAIIKKHEDLAIGNIIGSNIFNILGIVGSAGIVAPLDLHTVSSPDYFVMLGFTILFAILCFAFKTLPRWAGLLFLGGYIAYFSWTISSI